MINDALAVGIAAALVFVVACILGVPELGARAVRAVRRPRGR